MGLIPEDIIAEVRERTDIGQAIGEHVALTKSGAQLRGLCPFHTEKTASFYVYPHKQFFICYGCQKKGDVFAFLIELTGRSFTDVVRDLAARAGVKLPAESPEAERAGRAARSERERLLKVNALACDFFRAQYLAPIGARARQYVERRGASAGTAERFRLGYAPAGDGLTTHLERQKVPLALAEQAGLVAPSQRGAGYYDRFRERLMFPVLSAAGEVLGFSGRLLDPDAKAAKYVNSPETALYRKGHLLFGLFAARAAIHKTGRAVLVEGNFDVVQLHERGLEETVAPLGTALTEQQVTLLRRHLGEGHVVVLFDGDEAGHKATTRAVPLLVSGGLEARVARCAEGDDPDTLGRRDAEALKRLIDHATPALEYLIDEAVLTHGTSVDGRVKALRAIAPALRLVRDAAARDLYTGRVAAALGIDKRTVDRAVRLSVGPEPGPDAGAAPPAHRAARTGRLDPALERELQLLALLSEHRELCGEARDAERLLTQEPVRAALRALCAASSAELADEVLVRALPDELRLTLAERLLAGSFGDDAFGGPDAHRALAEILNALEHEASKTTMAQLDRAIAEATRTGDRQQLRELSMRKVELSKQRHDVAKV